MVLQVEIRWDVYEVDKFTINVSKYNFSTFEFFILTIILRVTLALHVLNRPITNPRC